MYGHARLVDAHGLELTGKQDIDAQGIFRGEFQV